MTPDLVPGENSLWARVYLWTHEYDWSEDWAFHAPCLCFCGVTWLITLIVSGFVLWRRMSSVIRVATVVCVADILGAASGGLSTLRTVLTHSLLSPWGKLGLVLWWVGHMSLPIYVLWCLRRGCAVKPQPMKLVAACLVIAGLFGGLGNIALIFESEVSWLAANVPVSNVSVWAHWAWERLWPVVPPLVYAACGLWLLLGRRKPITRVAWVLLGVTALNTCSSLALRLHMADAYPPMPWLDIVCQEAQQAYWPALALAFLVFVLRYRGGWVAGGSGLRVLWLQPARASARRPPLPGVWGGVSAAGGTGVAFGGDST